MALGSISVCTRDARQRRSLVPVRINRRDCQFLRTHAPADAYVGTFSARKNGTTGYSTGLFAGHDPTRGSGRGASKNATGRVRSGQKVIKISTSQKYRGSGQVRSGQAFFESRGSGRVGSRFFKSHGSGRVKKSSNITGRFRSGQEVMKSSWVGYGPARNG